MDPVQRIKELLENNRIVIFMKGSPKFPQCGFSMRTVEALKSCGAEFHHVDVIAEPEFRAHLPSISEWPTFPQVFIDGELIGGCDIVMGMYQSGELQTKTNAEKTGLL